MFGHIFREYDIRGIFERDLNEISTKAIGYALGLEMKKRGVESVSVGYDARLSADMLFKYLASGLNKANLQVFDIGLVPTPVGYFSTFTDNFDANIMITGSHNPKDYNGFKITIYKDSYFGQDLQELKVKVSEILYNKVDIENNFKAIKSDILSKYIDYISKKFEHLKGMKCRIISDCANGTAGVVLQKLKENLKLDMEILYSNPDGNFPNHHPDPSIEDNLKDIKNYLLKDFDIGFGFDGDSDRIAVVTKKRNIKGDELAYLYALNMDNPKIMGEVKFSQNIYEAINKIGSTYMGKTGHSNIKKAMKEQGIDLGAEVSGHIFFKERYLGFDDAIYAMLRMLELIYKGIDLDKELEKLPKVFSTDEIKIEVSEENKFDIVNKFIKFLKENSGDFDEILSMSEIDGIRVHFKDGWALLRASNTTPVLVARFEANSKKYMQELKNKFTNTVEKIKNIT
ncbi:phosphomannomutase / phosphoglucomutase [Campylobacter blaseri]|uniref:Phospho-sugar mutase n=1 Tax=Campylobacter blaseri TaxID=2042961 RepID=A0A2P8R2E8_9BACT|nr:phosphomannomutase/phosphoglucomutase [Campylobacter blaseri]PSM52684.1 phospho-sugar mutase [Campylobacter blaseri]PSM54332.1 phospho-sugar mutase [Campylobacter blaseri]QKF85984.1 phosphomannomutase / phosphoglucomutase [Campylobacter blaseri]